LSVVGFARDHLVHAIGAISPSCNLILGVEVDRFSDSSELIRSTLVGMRQIDIGYALESGQIPYRNQV